MEKPAKHGGDLHDLFLVDDDAVGVVEDLLKLRRLIGHERRVVAALDELVDHAAFQGTGPVQGDERHDVVELGGPQFSEKVSHAAAFKLEHAGGVARREELVGLPVVKGHRARSISMPSALRSFTMVSMRVRVSRPRKSILMSRSSRSSSCRTASPFHRVSPCTTGGTRKRCLLAITMPAACVDAWRASPFDDAGVVEKFPDAIVSLVQFAHLGLLVYRPFDAPVPRW
jgi:hypothetical protein